MRIRLEGGQLLPNSYGVAAQFIGLELLERPDLEVSYQAIPDPNSPWQSQTTAFPPQLTAPPHQLPAFSSSADWILRIHPSLNLQSKTSQKTAIFCSTPWGILPNSMVNKTLIHLNITNFSQLPEYLSWIVPCRWSRDGLLRSGIAPEKITIIPWGVSPEWFKPMTSAARQILRQRLGWEDYFVFLSSGRLDDRAGLRPLLKAFAQLIETHPHSRLVLKGCDALYNSQTALKKASRDILSDAEIARIQPRIAYIGQNFLIEQMAQLYQAADTYVSPYLASGFNLSVLEAMACGLPIICTSGGATVDFIRPEFALSIQSQFSTRTIDDQVKFFLHPDWEHLVNIMQTVIDQPNFCQHASQMAAQFAANYTWKHTVDGLLTTLKSDSTSSSAPKLLRLPQFPGTATPESDEFPVALKSAKIHSLIVEGWRSIPHSYALINCCQLLELIHHPQVQLFHRDMPYVTDEWKGGQGLFSLDAERFLDQIPQPEPNQMAEATLRMYCPFNLANSTSAKTVVFGCTEWGIIPQSILRGMKVKSFRQAHLESDTLIVTASHWSRQGFLNSGADPERVVVVPLGINPEIYHPVSPDQRQHLREKLGWEDCFVFLNIGVMWNERQGVDRLLKAFAAVSQRYPQARLFLKGRDAIFPSQASIQKASKNVLTEAELERVHSRLHYVGHTLSTQAMAEIYWGADAYVSPYSAEGFNLPVLEAIACGLPVICTAGGPTDDFVQPEFAWKIASQLKHFTERNGDTKFYLEPNQEHLTDLMFEMIEGSELGSQRAQIGSKFIAQEFTWANVIKKLWPLLFSET
ncbi:MAG: glycosyltransferase [Oscillatoriales cyanobacterium SM2_3_0]|nr:glycosyltransferase [Oscillatoriales cyanobacterium SM2_3_0]